MTKSEFNDHGQDSKEEHENDGDFSDEQDGREEALRALASYRAFQLTLLRHIADDPRFTQFSDESQNSKSSPNPTCCFEEELLDPALRTGMETMDTLEMEKL